MYLCIFFFKVKRWCKSNDRPWKGSQGLLVSSSIQYKLYLLLWSWMNQENIEPNITLNYAWTEFLCFHGFFLSLNTSFSYLVMKFWNKDFVYIIMIGWIREPLWSVPSHIPPRVNHTQKQQLCIYRSQEVTSMLQAVCWQTSGSHQTSPFHPGTPRRPLLAFIRNNQCFAYIS